MDLNYYLNKIKFQLTGDILESELSDESYKKIIEIALQEVNRYYDVTKLIEASGGSCIDIKSLEEKNNIKIGSVSMVYRCHPNGTTAAGETGAGIDPMMLSQWNLANNYYNYGTNRWVYNYLAYNTTNQISNTLSTDLDFKFDKYGGKLYINFTNGVKDDVVIEYVPVLENVEEVVGDYWIDILSRLSLAYAKITLGRVRTRYKLDNALWSQDGETLLSEGNEELKTIQERLRTYSNYVYPLD